MAGKPFAYYELISIHAPREGSDLLREGRTNKERNFNPRSPRGERPRWSRKTAGSSHFNPRSPRGERRPVLPTGQPGRGISIHAPREGSDSSGNVCIAKWLSISIHAPREGSDGRGNGSPRPKNNFNPRSPRGERHAKAKKIQRLINFNPRSPRGERPDARLTWTASRPFQSTLPARGATTPIQYLTRDTRISIHAPREGSDDLPY